MSPLRFVVLLAAATASLAAASRLWLSALTPRSAPFIAQLAPNRIVWDRSTTIHVAAPSLPELLREPRARPARRVFRPQAHTQVAAYRPASHTAPQNAILVVPATPPEAKPPATKPAPRPAPAPAPTPAPAPAPAPAPVPAPSPTPPAPTPPAPPPPVVTPPPPPPPPPTVTPPLPTRPGNGYGDTNHSHTGPPGQGSTNP